MREVNMEDMKGVNREQSLLDTSIGRVAANRYCREYSSGYGARQESYGGHRSHDGYGSHGSYGGSFQDSQAKYSGRHQSVDNEQPYGYGDSGERRHEYGHGHDGGRHHVYEQNYSSERDYDGGERRHGYGQAYDGGRQYGYEQSYSSSERRQGYGHSYDDGYGGRGYGGGYGY